jgi:hypothetical protein
MMNDFIKMIDNQICNFFILPLNMYIFLFEFLFTFPISTNISLIFLDLNIPL